MFDHLERLAAHLDRIFGLKPRPMEPGALYAEEIREDGRGGYRFDLNGIMDRYNAARGPRSCLHHPVAEAGPACRITARRNGAPRGTIVT